MKDRRIQFPRRPGLTVVHASDLKQYECPACNGTGKAIAADLIPASTHSERAWLCKLCGGPGFINCTFRTYNDLAARFKEGVKVYFAGGKA